MRCPKATSILANVVVWLGLGLCIANANTGKFKWQHLGDGSLEMRLERGWSVTKRVSFESEAYIVSERGESLFDVYLGNNPDLASILHDRIRDGEINGNPARRYYVKGSLTDVIVMPRCGDDKYAWLTRTSETREANSKINAAISSLRCISAKILRARSTLPVR